MLTAYYQESREWLRKEPRKRYQNLSEEGKFSRV